MSDDPYIEFIYKKRPNHTWEIPAAYLRKTLTSALEGYKNFFKVLIEPQDKENPQRYTIYILKKSGVYITAQIDRTYVGDNLAMEYLISSIKGKF